MQPDYLVILGLFTWSIVTPSPAVQKSCPNPSKSETREQRCVLHCYVLKLNCQVTPVCIQVLPLKSVCNTQVSGMDGKSAVQHSVFWSISLIHPCYFKSPNDATFLGTVTSFPPLPLCSRSWVVWSVCRLTSNGNDLLLRHNSWEEWTLLRRKLPLSCTMTPNYHNLFNVIGSPRFSKCINFYPWTVTVYKLPSPLNTVPYDDISVNSWFYYHSRHLVDICN